MKCPYCSREMTSGYIYNANQPLQWIPEGKKPSWLSYTATDYGVKLNNNFSMFKMGGYTAEAFYCDACHIVLAKTEE